MAKAEKETKAKTTLPGAEETGVKTPETSDSDPEIEEEAPASKPAQQKAVKAPTVDLSKFDKETKGKARQLIAAGKEITGEETPDLIDTLFSELEEEEIGETSEQEEIAGMPNHLPVRAETINVNGKQAQFPVYFVADVKGGKALYNEVGQRVSPLCTNDSTPNISYIMKAAVRNNALRRANRMPNEAR